MFSTLRLGLLGILFASSLAPAGADEKVRVRTLLVSGTRANDLPPDVVYAAFIDVDYSRRGGLAFRAALSGPGVTIDDDAANYIGDERGVRLLARDGDPVAGRPGLVHQGQCYFCAIGPIPGPRVDTRKGTFFTTLVQQGTLFSGQALSMSDDLGAVTTLFVSGDPAPGNPSFPTLSFFGTPFTNDRGDFAFGAQLVNDVGLGHSSVYAGQPGALRLVVEEDDPVPGLPGWTIAAAFPVLALDRNGRVALSAWLDDGSGFASNGLLSERSGALELLLRAGDPFPNEVGLTVGSFTTPVMDARGGLALIAFGPFFHALLTDRGGTWETVARLGDAPRVLPGDSYSRLFSPLMNASGALVFRADLNMAGPQGDDDQLLLVDDGVSQRVVARSGQPAAGLAAGIVYDGLWPLAFNDRGQVAFIANLAGVGVDGSNSAALYLTDRRGAPRLVVRAGDSIEVRPGDVRTLVHPLPVHFGSFSPVSLNERGQLAFIASFEGNATAVLEALVREKLARAKLR